MGLLCVIAGCGDMPESELARRVAAADPAWEDYEEDIKAMLGPAYIGEWSGAPERAWQADGYLYVRFFVEGPWARRDVAIPVLVRDPALNVLRHEVADIDPPGGSVTYRFPMAADSASVTSWVEVKYPHHSRRLAVKDEASE